MKPTIDQAGEVLRNRQHQRFLAKCRSDFPTFFSYVIVVPHQRDDAKDESVEQEIYTDELGDQLAEQELVLPEYAKSEPYNIAWDKHLRKFARYHCGVISPTAFGKTLFLIGRILWWLGRDRNELIGVVHSRERMAMDRVKVVTSYIENSTRLHEVFPKLLKPMQPVVWNDHQIQLDRDVQAPDPSLTAYSYDTRVSGAHLTRLVFDDLIDIADANQPQTRAAHIQQYDFSWKERLQPKGRMFLFIMHRWSRLDIVAERMKDPEWRILVQGISDDCNRIEQPPQHIRESTGFLAVEPCDKAEYELPSFLISRKPEWETLKKYHPRKFGFAQQQKTYDTMDTMFEVADLAMAFDYSLPVEQIVKQAMVEHWPKIVTTDFSGKKRKGSVILTGAINPRSRRKYIINARVGNWGAGPAFAQEMVAEHMAFSTQGMWIEDMTLQGEFAEWLNVIYPKQMFPCFPLGGQGKKLDPEVGLPGLAAEFRSGQWCIPLAQIAHLGDMGLNLDNAWCRLVHEFQNYPNSTDDLLMAFWLMARVFKGDQFGSIAPILTSDTPQSAVKYQFSQSHSVMVTGPSQGPSFGAPVGNHDQFGFSKRPF